MSGHTKKAREVVRHSWEVCSVYDENDELIAKFEVREYEEDVEERAMGEARLLVAAPDLLEALRLMTPSPGFPKCDRRCASVAPAPDEDPRCDCGFEEIRTNADVARAVLAKAEGK